MEITHLQSAEEFESLKQSHPLLVVDFYSDECPPCEKLAPIYEKLAAAFSEVKFVKIFRQKFRDLAVSVNVSGSPTLIFFKNGELLDTRLSGEISELDLNTALEALTERKNEKKDETETVAAKYDLCIIGNGPAGLSAAVYAARYKVNQVLVGDLPGGLMTSSHKICNFPSQVEISGMDLSQMMADQVTALEVPQKMARVESIEQIDKLYRLKLSNDEMIEAKTILIATGTKHRHLGLDNEQNLAGRGISYCATCDAMFFRNKVVAVVGGSDSANTAALYLAQVATKVYQIYRGEALRGETAWIDQIKANDKISLLFNTNVTELIGSDKLEGIKIDAPFEGSNEIKLDGLFVEVGSEPELTLINQLSLETTKGNYIITKENQSTSREGVWAAGDITTNSDSFRQIITACSEGAIAAQSIFKYIQLN